jgi:ABC-2 type transport system ATP-binding protein
MRGSKDLSIAKRLIDRFELDADVIIKKMSKGMKQKLGIVCAFMSDPSILILDEPSSGLDPLMQNKFVELINEQKKLGKTILMSSHSFEEVERTCDRIGIIKKGRLVTIESVANLKQTRRRTYLVTFENSADAEAFASEIGGDSEGNTVKAVVQGEIKPFLNTAVKYSVTGLDAVTQSLEDVFMHYYGEE